MVRAICRESSLYATGLFACSDPHTLTSLAAQHYLIHLLREKLVASKSRVVIVSSGAIRRVSDTCMFCTKICPSLTSVPSLTVVR